MIHLNKREIAKLIFCALWARFVDMITAFRQIFTDDDPDLEPEEIDECKFFAKLAVAACLISSIAMGAMVFIAPKTKDVNIAKLKECKMIEAKTKGK